MESEQLISLTFTKIYLYCLKATEKGSKLDPAMFSGHGEVPRLHLCILHTHKCDVIVRPL